MRRSFAERSTETELMDTEPVGFEEFAACLRDLATVNTLTLARPPTLGFLAEATRNMRRGDTLSVLDVGFGHGDMLRTIHRWCLKRGFVPDLSGVDLNPWSAASAEAATPSDMRIDYRTGDVFDDEPARPPQFMVSSLFTHHLGDAQLVDFLRHMERTAAKGWFVNDLHRHAVPFHVFRVMSRLARWHRFVRHDGPVSIARAFSKGDWRRLVAQAGLPADAVSIRWHMPFRITVGRIK